MRRAAFCAAFSVCALVAVPVLGDKATRTDMLELIQGSLTAGEGLPAHALLDRYLEQYPRTDKVAELEVLTDFYTGDYESAANGVLALREDPRSTNNLGELADVIVRTYETTRGYERFRHENFEVLYSPGDDEILVPYAIDTLKAATEALEAELGVKMVSPVRLEIYPDAESLAEVSTLSVEAIRTTGIIALCKWGRLMIASPRAMMRGYPWLDTISHEYVHLLLTKATLDRAPVWLHEGIAKFLETRWRVRRAALPHDPASAQVLATAVAADHLLDFERLHPSIALLPTHQAAVLAFAQMSTFVEAYYSEYGRDGLREALDMIKAGQDARKALALAADTPWKKLEESWKKGLKEAPAAAPVRLMPHHLSGEASEQDEVASVELERARKLVRLGDLLWTRSRPAAASVEYGKAHLVAPSDPVVASRYARSAIAGDRPEDALLPLSRTLRRYPSHAPAVSSLATAQFRTSMFDAARASAYRAISLNPFDPQPHCILAELSLPQSQHEAELCSRLGGMRE